MNQAITPPEQPQAQTSMAQMRANQLQQASDQAVNMFTLRGFELARRIAKDYATSDAVPAMYRYTNQKKVNGELIWVPNEAAIGNCIVAVEVAQAIGMSITAVMQNANVIEGRLTWSGKFIIGAINATRRFSPLRFDFKEKGLIKTSYKEKEGWNKVKGGFDFKTVEVEINNIECRAWALPGGMSIPPDVWTLDQAKDRNLPVIVGPLVSMKMAVEEGWYSKPGSKWQGDMWELMMQYRAGSFFGNIHAPEVTMGMGKSTEEAIDTIDVYPQTDGTYSVNNAATMGELRQQAAPAPSAAPAPVEAAEQAKPQASEAEPASAPVHQAAPEQTADLAEFDKIKKSLLRAKSGDTLDLAADMIRTVADDGQRNMLNSIYRGRKSELDEAATQAAEAPAAAAPRARATRSNTAIE